MCSMDEYYCVLLLDYLGPYPHSSPYLRGRTGPDPQLLLYKVLKITEVLFAFCVEFGEAVVFYGVTNLMNSV